MLQDAFYTLTAPPAITATTVQASLRLRPEHAIFAGHFPGQPVVPGVCLLQLLKELLEGATQQSLQLVRAGNVKFLTVLVPGVPEIVHAQLKFESSEDGILVSEATISAGADRFLKLQQAHYAFRIPAHGSAFAKPLRPT
ncbi:MAG: 3-hydroxylacyl-ACP dehydratase [Hymenobacter sp.]|nr:MAG: 3-hydroxylacyl-ACP dehydratase [Hymenobacter sp.]